MMRHRRLADPQLEAPADIRGMQEPAALGDEERGFIAVGTTGVGTAGADVYLVRTRDDGSPLWELTYDVGPGGWPRSPCCRCSRLATTSATTYCGDTGEKSKCSRPGSTSEPICRT